MYFDEGDITEYLGIKLHPEPDTQTENSDHEKNSFKHENLPNKGFLCRPIEIWV